jgi:hypothetical protein
VPTLGRLCRTRQTSLDEGQPAHHVHERFPHGTRTFAGHVAAFVFPDLNADGEALQTNLIMPEPTIFLDRKFPIVSIVRPTQTKGAAMGALKALTADGLFIGQTPEFFTVLTDLAKAADAARHGT